MTEKQKIFADEYLIDLNATRAYRVAYPNCRKDSSADAAARKLLGNTRIQMYISERMEERQKRTEITQDRVLEELAAIAFAKATDYVTVRSNGQEDMVCIKPTDALTENQQKAIAGIKEGRNGIEVKLNDKEKALELLGRHLGMFKDKMELSGTLETEKTKLDDLIKQMRGDG